MMTKPIMTNRRPKIVTIVPSVAFVLMMANTPKRISTTAETHVRCALGTVGLKFKAIPFRPLMIHVIPKNKRA